MTRDARSTAIFMGAAGLLAIAAWGPALLDRDTPRDPEAALFFPAFTDPNAATTLEVVDIDPETSALRAFKVTNRDGRWTIPSHGDYPADGGDRLASIAAALVALRRQEEAGDLVADHARFGVLDPLDEALPSAAGKGTRITVRGTNDVVLADVILGRPLEGRPALRYVRQPDERTVYVASLGHLNVSTRFDDWIERNLLLVNREEIDQIVIRNYTADPREGTIRERDRVVLRAHEPDVWAADGLRPGEALDTFTANLLVTRLVELQIAGVVPKPPAVAERLGRPGGSALAAADVAELAGRGFYFTSDGRLLSSQGEVLVHTRSGIFYALRFGESVRLAGTDMPGRYLFISTGFDGPGGAAPSGQVRDRLELLRARFAPWYYVVPDEDVSKIRVPRAVVVRRAAASP